MPALEISIDSGPVALALKIWGSEDGLPVLALHGWMDNAGSFDVLAPMLPGIRLIALDFPGHGSSARRAEQAGYYIWSYLEEVLTVVNALGLERFSLLGHSMGGAVCMLFSAVFPERVSSVALLDSLGPLATVPDQAPFQMRRALDMAAKARTPRYYPDRESAVAARVKRGVLPATAAILGRRGICSNENGYYWDTDRRLTFPNPLSMSEAQVQGFLARIGAPVLLIAAREFWAGRRQMFTERTGALSDLTVEMLEGSHYQHLEEQAPCIAELLDGFFTGPTAYRTDSG